MFLFLFTGSLSCSYAALMALASLGLPRNNQGHVVLSTTWWRRALMWPGPFMARLALLLSLGMWVTVTPDSDLRTHNEKVRVVVCVGCSP